MSKKRIVSGMRPTGKLHLGHYEGVLSNWVNLQDEFESFFFVADWHALTTKFDKTETLKQDRLDAVLDWLACGIDPEKSTIYIQSDIPQIAELHVLFSMITPQNWVERDPTLKDMVKILRDKRPSNKAMFKADTSLSENFEKAKKELEEKKVQNRVFEDISYGLLGYPVLMASDILMFNADVVPVGIDQMSHLEITRDIARRFNHLYKVELFNEPAAKLTQIPLMKGLDGQKMGKSFNNDIKISDDAETTTKKVMKAITDRSRVRKDDPGHPDKCEVAFEYYQIFGDEDIVKVVETECKAGERGCADCKRQLASIINEKFAPIREKRIELASDMDYVKDVLNQGKFKAREEAQKVLDKAKEAAGL